MIKCLKKCNDAVFRGCKQRTKVQRIDLAFKNLKINRKQGNQSNKKQKLVGLMLLEFKVQETQGMVDVFRASNT